jgi:hypothetical protein
MEEKCFMNEGSDPAFCGAHKVPLVRQMVPIDANAPWLGRISCFLCPVGRIVVEMKGGSHAPKKL